MFTKPDILLLYRSLQAYVEYDNLMARMMTAIDPLFDSPPLHAPSWTGPHKSLRRAWKNRSSLTALLSAGKLVKINLRKKYRFGQTDIRLVNYKGFSQIW